MATFLVIVTYNVFAVRVRVNGEVTLSQLSGLSAVNRKEIM